MKKNLLLSIALLCATFTFAQLNFGIKAGYNSSLSLSNIENLKNGSYTLKNVSDEMGNGFHAGAFARIGIDKLYIQPELLYAMSKKEYTLTLQDAVNKNVTFDKLVTVSTVDIPILVGYKLLDLEVVNLRAFAGPKFRLNAGSKLEFKNVTSTDGSTITKADLMDDIKSAQVGLEAGIGIDVLMFTLDARVNLINNMARTKIGDVTVDEVSANSFVISLGWKLF